jgi:hypothetical protein
MSFWDEKRRFPYRKPKNSQIEGKSGRIGGSLIDQQYRDVIAYGVDAVAGIALEGFGVGLEDERLLTSRTDQDFEEVGGNHGGRILLRKSFPTRGTETQREGQIRMNLLNAFKTEGDGWRPRFWMGTRSRERFGRKSQPKLRR